MSEKAISLVSEEWNALGGIPYLQFRLYLVLRWYMDIATRRVGTVRGISLQGLCEELYIDPAPGRVESGSPTKKAVRSALLQLEKRGLIEPCGNGEVLVFLLPKADVVSARAKLKGHKRGTATWHATGHAESLEPQGNADDMGHAKGQPQTPLKGHTSELRVNPLSVEASAATVVPVDNFSDEARLLLEPLDAERVAAYIRSHEQRRGLVARVTARDVDQTDWIATGLTAAELREVCDLGRVDREVTKNPSPLNVPFLATLLHRVRKGRVVCRGEGDQPAVAWHVTEAGVEAKAAEVGLLRQTDEPIDQLRGRVAFRLAEIERDKKAARRVAASAAAAGVRRQREVAHA